MCVARYSAIFPLSKLINIFFKARGARTDELPHSYQMMLFWAGLRGAVGVALAEGMKGEHAVALRTTVLVGVVMTVVVFGGTIGRMIDILGIRTGVEEDDDSESEGEGGEDYLESGSFRHTKRRSHPVNSLGNGSGGGLGNNVQAPGDSPYRDRVRLAPQVQYRSNSVPNSDQSASSDSDPDVLPPAESEGMAGDLTRVWRDGQWFTVLDERYLLPVFSNATASRRQASKKAMLKAKRHSFAVEGPEDYDNDAAGTSPYLGGQGGRGTSRNKDFQGSFTVSSSGASLLQQR